MPANNSLGSALNLLSMQSDSVTAGLPDFYRFTLAGRSSVNLTLNGLSGNADLQLLNGAGAVIPLPLNQGTLAESINRVLEAGTYYLQVSLGAGSSAANYSLGFQAQSNPFTGIVWRNYAGGQNAIWQIDNNGTILNNAGFASAPTSWQIEATGEFNGDGQQDLVFRDRVSGDVRIWVMDGVVLSSISSSLGAAADPWEIRGAGDFNGDGKTDLVWRNKNSGQNVIWLLNNAPGTTLATTLTQIVSLPDVADLSWQLQGIGDFNRDGKNDLVWRNQSSGQNVVWIMDTTPGTTWTTTIAGLAWLPAVTDLNFQLQGVGDLNRDGRPDLFWRNMSMGQPGSGQNLVWTMTGTNGTDIASTFFVSSIEDSNWRAVAPLLGFNAPTPIDVAGNAQGAAFNIGTLNGYGTYRDTVSGSDPDFYQFTLLQGGRVNLGVYGGADAILSSSLVNYGGFTQDPVSGKRLSPLLPAGTYSIQVYATGGFSGAYTLELGFPIPATPSLLQLAPASDSGASASDRITRVKTPTITGRAEAFTTVQVFNGAQFLGTTTANSNGDWQFTTGVLADGSNSLTARAVSAAGSTSAASAALVLTIDSAAPQFTLTTALEGTQLTAQSRLTGSVNGTGSGVSSLQYRFNSLPLVSVALSQTGTFDQLIDSSSLHSGTYSLTLIATDIAGNTMTSTPISVVVPLPTVPTQLGLDAGSDSGMSQTDGITNNSTPTITGKAKAGEIIQLLEGAQLLGQATADANGNWSITTGVLGDGVRSLKAKALNGLGDFSADSAILSIVIDTQAPVAPIVDKINYQNIDDPSYFSHVYPLVEGRAETNSLVRLFVDGSAVDLLMSSVSQTTLAANGSWGAKIFGLLNGIHTLTTTATDLAGNVSTISTPKTIRNDISPPTLTLTTPINTTQLSPGARFTGSASDRWSGLDVITYQFDERTPISIAFSATGAFDQAIDFTGLTNGQHSLRIQVADRVGFYHMTAFSVAVIIDQTPPVLSIGLLQDTAIGGTNTDRITANPTIQGTVTDASRITALRAGFENNPSALVDVPASLWQSAGGTFTLSRTQLDAFYGGVLPDGAHTLRLQAQDEYGNVVNTNLAFTLDTTSPIAPSLQWVTATVNGQVQNSIHGQAEANAVVKVTNNGKFLGQVTAGTDGTWKLDSTGDLTGTQLFTATATDGAGNVSLVSPTLKVVNGIVAALAPTSLSLAIASDSGTVGDRITQSTTPTIQGKAEPGARIKLFVDGQLSGTTVASAAGDWSVTLTTPLSNGVRVITATARNLQGDDSVLSLPLALTIDTLPPTVSLRQTPQTIAPWTRLVGSVSEAPLASLAYRIDGSTSRLITVDEEGGFNQAIDLSNLSLDPQTPHTLTLTAIDLAGNISTQTFTVSAVAGGTDPATVLPSVNMGLLRDTAAKGKTNADGVTFDPTVTAIVSSPNLVTKVEARIGDTGAFTVLAIQPDASGQVTLERAVLEALNGGSLLDGSYTVALRVTDTFGNVSAVSTVPLTLQTVLPQLSLTDVPDGIHWEFDQPLTGQVEGGAGLVLSYRLNGGVERPVSFSAGDFEAMLPLESLGFGAHQLTVTARDQAGNEQEVLTNFLLKQDQPLLDADPDSRSTPPRTPGGLTTTKATAQTNVSHIEGLSAGGSPGNGDNRNPLYTGAYWQGGSDWDDTYDEEALQEAAIGAAYGSVVVEADISYIDRIQSILDQADDVMATSPRRAALRNRRPVLMEVAEDVEAGTFYEPMYPGLYGIYAMAAQVMKKSEARRIGDYLALQISDPTDPAVRVQTFQTETLAAIQQEVMRRGVMLDEMQQQELSRAALGLAYAYSQLDPRMDAERTQTDFLGKLWRAQGQPDASLVDLAGTDLRDLLLEVPDDRGVQTISFLGNLLKAANGVQALNQGGDLRDPTFLRELVKFGVEYAKLDPDTSLSSQPQGWLDELWRAGSTPGVARNRAVKKGATGLSAFLGGMETPQGRIEGVKFGERLLKANALLTGNGLENQKRDPKFVEALLGLGGSYMTLRSKSSSKGDIGINQNLFLDAIWRTENVRKGAEDIQRFLAQISSRRRRKSSPPF